MKRFWFATTLILLLILAACSNTGGPTPTLTVSPTSATVTAGGKSVSFTATLKGSSDTVQWSLSPASGVGTIAPTSGKTTTYTPPASVTKATTVTLTATAGKLMAKATITLNPAAQTQVYVDPVNGSDSNDGTQNAPVKTIRHALTLAKGGKTVYLAGGVYDETSGETFIDETDGKRGYLIPEGVQIMPDLNKSSTPVVFKTDHPDKGANGFRFAGNGRLSNIEMDGFYDAISATTGAQDLSDLTLKGITETGIELTGTASLTCSSCTISVDNYYALHVKDNARLKVDGGSLNKASPGSVPYIAAIDLESGSVELDNLSTSGGYQVFGGTLTTNNVNADLSDLDESFMQVASGAELSMTDGQVTGGWFNSGSSAQPVLTSSGTLNINGTVFDGNKGGAIELDGGTATIQNATFQNIGDPNAVYAGFGLNAITVYKATKLTMRTTSITNVKAAFNSNPPIPGKAGVGVYIDDASGSIDLGTDASSGRNILTDCGGSGLEVVGSGSQASTVQAVGNTWNASVQGADANGHYPTMLVAPTSSESGNNYIVIYPNAIQF